MNKWTKIVPNKRYTMLTFNEFGYPCIFQVKAVSVKEVNHKQYQYALPEKSIEFIFILKRKRHANRLVVKDNTDIVVWEGWHDIDATKTYTDKYGCKCSEWTCFDSQSIGLALANCTEEPIILQTKQDFHGTP